MRNSFARVQRLFRLKNQLICQNARMIFGWKSLELRHQPKKSVFIVGCAECWCPGGLSSLAKCLLQEASEEQEAAHLVEQACSRDPLVCKTPTTPVPQYPLSHGVFSILRLLATHKDCLLIYRMQGGIASTSFNLRGNLHTGWPGIQLSVSVSSGKAQMLCRSGLASTFAASDCNSKSFCRSSHAL